MDSREDFNNTFKTVGEKIMSTEVRMKTLVKYQAPKKYLSARFGRKRYMVPAGVLTELGAGDCTVQEDGQVVWVGRTHIERIAARSLGRG